MAPSIFQAAFLLMLASPALARLDSNAVLVAKRDGPIIPAILPGTWTYQGCYTENGPRTLDGKSYTSTTNMTDEYCIGFCDQNKYIYAGTEYSQECYCSNTIASSSSVAASTDCNMGCSGNTTELCGGGARLSLFWNGKNPPLGPSTNPGVAGYGFYGCYTEGNNGRALTTGPVTITGGSSAMTVALCISACKTAGFSMAGIEYADECYCGNALANTPTVAPGGLSDCNMLCAGNSSEYCGAGNRLDVYKQGYLGSQSTVASVVVSSTATSSSTSPSSSQVSTSSSSTRVSTTTSSGTKTSSSTSSVKTTSSQLSGTSKSSSLSSTTNTPTKSSTGGVSSSSSASSTRSGSSSLPGSASSSGSSSSPVVKIASSTTSSSASTTPTLGIKTTVGPYTFQGCYTEGTGARALTGASFFSYTTMTLESCATSCSGFKYFGVEYGGECYCGNTLDATSTPAALGDCSFICPGNSYEYCGAGNRLEMYMIAPISSSSSVSFTASTSSSSSASVSSNVGSSTVSPSGSSTGSSSVSGSKTGSSSVSSSKTGSSTVSPSGLSTGSSSVSSYKTGSSTIVPSSSVVSSTTATPTPTGPTTVQTVANYIYYGCYTEGTGVRALSPGAFPADTMTVEMCQASCSAYTYFGVEYGRECYCGNSLAASSTVAPAGDCNMLCAGNNFEYCGAGNRLNVYVKNGTAVPTTAATGTASTSTASQTSSATGLPAGWKYDGCYTEGTGGRALSYQQAGGNTNTVESCVATCIAAGYTVAGMEYSSQCFCDNFLYNGAAPTDASKCSMPCAGNANEMCGAGDIISLYNTGNLTAYAAPSAQKTNLPGSWTYQGCYSDNVNNNRALFWQSILTNNNTATSCLSLCAQYGYMAAGMEYGDECYCGDDSVLVASGSTIQPETDCQVACSGDQNYYCGGGSRLSYYKWTGTPLYTWNTPTGTGMGKYSYLIGGVVVPLITTTGINNKIVFMEKSGTGAPNTTGTYELDLTFINDVSKAWRPLHVKSDIFCSAGVTLPDKAGRQLNIGGWAGASTYGVRLYWPDGSPGVPGVNDWQENVNEISLLAGRWYPSAMVMTNGSVLVLGGEVGSNSAPTPSCEILPPPPGGYAKYLDWLDRTDPDNLYPFMFVLPSGGIFVVYYNEARILDESTFDTIKTLPNMPGSVNNFLSGRTYPLEGTGVIFPQYPPYTAPVTVLVCGGSANGAAYAVDNCVSTQPEVAAPTWTLERMPSQRVMSCICALPDGTYLILNGAQEGVAGFGLATDPNYNAVLYDPTKPVNARMSIMDTTIVARLYHSEAILMPDGRVMVSGSDPEDGTHPEEYRVEVFSPPYALSGLAAPSYTITTANKDWTYGSTYTITANIPSGNLGAVRISMMAAVSSTHGNSMGQRTLFLTASCAGASNAATCSMTAPPTPHVAPPGWYQIFVLDGPTPGPANWVRIGGSIADAAGLGNWPAQADFNKPGLGAVGS